MRNGPAENPGDSILALLPHRRRNPLCKLWQRIIDDKPQAGDASWRQGLAILCADFLDDFRIEAVHINRLNRRANLKPDMLSAVERLAELFNARPFADFERIDVFFDDIDLNHADRPAIKTIFGTFFVIDANIRLQILYRMFLDAAAPGPRPSHAERIEVLSDAEPLAYALLGEIDPGRLVDWLDPGPRPAQIDEFLGQLSNFFFKINRVNFRFTYHCNISCKHCYNFSGPHLKGDEIDVEKMVGIIHEMPAANIDQLNISGGEPMMYLDTVVRLIQEARARNIKGISIYTNGFWAKSPAKGRQVLGKLKDAGFMNEAGGGKDHIKVSAGVYHREFIDLDTIVNAAEIYHDMFGKKLRIDYEFLGNAPETRNEVASEFERHGVADKVTLLFRGIFAAGRGVDLVESGKSHEAGHFGSCGDINQIVFDPDGSVRPCCGMNFDNDGVIIGNISDNTLMSLVKSMQNNPILQLIASHRIGDVFEYGDIPPEPEGYPDICALCAGALGNPDNNQLIKDRLTAVQEFYPFWFSAEKLSLADAET